MKLDERKRKVLEAIVEAYIKTGEPIGSKLIAEQLEFAFSSATIRNDMAFLFDIGLLEQPHTSAGRVPSYMGYRLYVDQIMHCTELTQQEKDKIDALFNVRNPDPDKVLQDAAAVLAEYTNCAAISMASTPSTVKLKYVSIVPAGINAVVIVAIATNGVIKDKICRVDFVVTQEIVDFFNKFANSRFSGRELGEISVWYVQSVAAALDDYNRMFSPLVTALYELCKEISEGQYYISGPANLLAYSEFSLAPHKLFLFLNKRAELLTLMERTSKNIRITIGKENMPSELSDTSVVVSHYKIGEHSSGAIGVIGPVRLDYAKLIPHLEYFSQNLGKLLSDAFDKTT